METSYELTEDGLREAQAQLLVTQREALRASHLRLVAFVLCCVVLC